MPPRAAARIQTRRSVSPEGVGRSRNRDDSEKISSSPSSPACTTVLAIESIAPDATAIGAEMPWRWKKRMLIAIRARFEGSATFM